MKTVDIKGKEYVQVNERIKYFRENYPNWSLTSEIINLEPDMCVIKAHIKDENDRTIATGIAYEKEGSSFINKTSYIENCETSAWGRALGNLGIGIDASIASAEEVSNAILNQNKPTMRDDAKIYIALTKINTKDELESYYNVNKENVIDREKFYKAVIERQKGLRKVAKASNEGKTLNELLAQTTAEEVPF